MEQVTIYYPQPNDDWPHYRCHCQYGFIEREFVFCPHCGAKINWQLLEAQDMTTEKKHPVPDDCTSSMCDKLGDEYCRGCSHAIFRGRSKVDGVMYRWILEPYDGVTFLTKDGDPLTTDETPGKNHPVRQRYGAWLKRRGFK